MSMLIVPPLSAIRSPFLFDSLSIPPRIGMPLHFIPIIGNLFETREKNPDYDIITIVYIYICIISRRKGEIFTIERGEFDQLFRDKISNSARFFETFRNIEISQSKRDILLFFPPPILLAFVLRGPASDPRALNSANLLPWTTRGVETPVPGRAQRANVTFTLHSFPNFTTWLYVVKIDIGNWCVHTKRAKYRSEKVSRTETFSAESESPLSLSFRPFSHRRILKFQKYIYFQYYSRIKWIRRKLSYFYLIIRSFVSFPFT